MDAKYSILIILILLQANRIKTESSLKNYKNLEGSSEIPYIDEDYVSSDDLTTETNTDSTFTTKVDTQSTVSKRTTTSVQKTTIQNLTTKPIKTENVSSKTSPAISKSIDSTQTEETTTRIKDSTTISYKPTTTVEKNTTSKSTHSTEELSSTNHATTALSEKTDASDQTSAIVSEKTSISTQKLNATTQKSITTVTMVEEDTISTHKTSTTTHQVLFDETTFENENSSTTISSSKTQVSTIPPTRPSITFKTTATTLTTSSIISIIKPKRCPYSYTGSQCNYQTYWCPNMICLGDPRGSANCYNYISYDCNCKSNVSCIIENAEPSFLNGYDCFDINRVYKKNGVYYNFFAEFMNYNNDEIDSYSCGCKQDFGQKNIKKCEISSCAINATNPCSSDDTCLENSSLNNRLNILYCSCQPGENCLKRGSDMCEDMPCANHSVCHALFTNSFFTDSFSSFPIKKSFTCKCNSSNQADCFKDNDPCAQNSSQCMNGGTCVSVMNTKSSHCLCPEGTTGKDCSLFLKCLEPLKYGREPCLFGGNCTYSMDDYYLGNDYTCECKEGFSGKYCDQCPPGICKNGGKCTMNINGKINCKCPYGYKGENCETRYDFCEFNDDFHCNNITGECATYKDYYCNCDANEGKCEMQLCNFATGCVNIGRSCLAPPDFHSYGCNCYMFSRTLFENTLNGRCNLGNMDSCNERIFSVNQNINWYYDITKVENTCMENKCRFGFDSYISYYSYFCECNPGEKCLKSDLIDSCSENLCNPNKSTCMAYSQMDKYYCKCHENATERECHKETHPCLNNPCKNGGTCLARIERDGISDSIQTAYCLCPKGASGTYCENLRNYCAIPFCGLHGKCTSTRVGHFKCECDSGYKGKYCDQKVESCDPNTCHNNGKCLVKNKKIICKCNDGWFGDFCEITAFFLP